MFSLTLKHCSLAFLTLSLTLAATPVSMASRAASVLVPNTTAKASKAAKSSQPLRRTRRPHRLSKKKTAKRKTLSQQQMDQQRKQFGKLGVRAPEEVTELLSSGIVFDQSGSLVMRSTTRAGMALSVSDEALEILARRWSAGAKKPTSRLRDSMEEILKSELIRRIRPLVVRGKGKKAKTSVITLDGGHLAPVSSKVYSKVLGIRDPKTIRELAADGVWINKEGVLVIPHEIPERAKKIVRNRVYQSKTPLPCKQGWATGFCTASNQSFFISDRTKALMLSVSVTPEKLWKQMGVQISNGEVTILAGFRESSRSQKSLIKIITESDRSRVAAKQPAGPEGAKGLMVKVDSKNGVHALRISDKGHLVLLKEHALSHLQLVKFQTSLTLPTPDKAKKTFEAAIAETRLNSVQQEMLNKYFSALIDANQLNTPEMKKLVSYAAAWLDSTRAVGPVSKRVRRRLQQTTEDLRKILDEKVVTPFNTAGVFHSDDIVALLKAGGIPNQAGKIPLLDKVKQVSNNPYRRSMNIREAKLISKLDELGIASADDINTLVREGVSLNGKGELMLKKGKAPAETVIQVLAKRPNASKPLLLASKEKGNGYILRVMDNHPFVYPEKDQDFFQGLVSAIKREKSHSNDGHVAELYKGAFLSRGSDQNESRLLGVYLHYVMGSEDLVKQGQAESIAEYALELAKRKYGGPAYKPNNAPVAMRSSILKHIQDLAPNNCMNPGTLSVCLHTGFRKSEGQKIFKIFPISETKSSVQQRASMVEHGILDASKDNTVIVEGKELVIRVVDDFGGDTQGADYIVNKQGHIQITQKQALSNEVSFD